MKKIFLVFAAFAFAKTLNAQNSIKGQVYNKQNHEKLSGAHVFIPELNTALNADANGDFNFAGLKEGSYTIVVAHLGYQTNIVKLHLKGRDTVLDLGMTTSPIVVNEVVVSGTYTTTQDESPFKIDVIKKSEMTQTGAATVMDVIGNVPGVSAISTGPLISRPSIRGLSGNRILTVSDGIRYETQQWDDEHGIGINQLGMDRIEIIKGPASLLYGPEAMGGVVHFIEEQPAEEGQIKGQVFGSCFSNNMGFQAGANIKGANKKFFWNVGLLGNMLPDYYSDGYEFRTPNTRMNEFGAKGSIGINRKWGTSTLSYQFNQAYHGILDGKDLVRDANGKIINKDTAEVDMFPSEIEAPYHSVTDNRISSQTTFLKGGSQFKLTLGYQYNNRAEFEDNGTKEGENYLDMTLNTMTYKLNWIMPTWKNFSTTIGVQGMYQMNKNADEAHAILIPDAKINDLGFVAFTKYHKNHLNLTGGVRYDTRTLETDFTGRDSIAIMFPISRSYNNISGAIGATYDVKGQLILRANFASGYRAPNLNELMANGVKLETEQYEMGNRNFAKEQNNEIDFGLTFLSKHFSVDVSAFSNTITNFIYKAPTGDSIYSYILNDDAPIYKYMQSNVEIQGGEAIIDIHPATIRWAHFEIKASTLTATRTDNDSYLPMMPTDKLCNTLYLNFKDWKKFKNPWLRIGTITAMEQTKVASEELTTPGYNLFNLGFGASRNIWKLHDIDFTLAVRNLLDEKYLDNLSRLRPFGIYNPGRNIVLTIRVPFEIKK